MTERTCGLAKGSMILTTSGYLPVEEIEQRSYSTELVIDTRIDCLQQDNRVYTKTIKKVAEPVDTEEILTEDNTTLKVTPDYEVYIERDGKLVPVKVANLTKGDKLVLQQVTSLFGSTNAPRIAYLLGSLLLDDATKMISTLSKLNMHAQDLDDVAKYIGSFDYESFMYLVRAIKQRGFETDFTLQAKAESLAKILQLLFFQIGVKTKVDLLTWKVAGIFTDDIHTTTTITSIQPAGKSYIYQVAQDETRTLLVNGLVVRDVPKED